MISNKITTGVRDPINNRVRFENRTQRYRSLDYSNLPTKITCTNPIGGGSRFIYFVYDASGQKHQKIVKDINCGFGGCTYPAPVTYTYVNGIEYKNDVLQRIAHTEGSVALQADGTTYAHEYVIKDHLGNTRVTYRDDDKPGSPLGTIKVDEIVQINHQYPFGLNMEGNWNGSFPEAKNKYQFGGKELNSDFGLGWNDFGARFYDPSVSRWLSVDPMAEKMHSYSPYNYAFNNPIRFIDPDGMQAADIIIMFREKKGDPTISVKYDNGKLITSNGNEYTGNNSYILEVRDILNCLKETDPKVKEVIADLEKKGQDHSIANFDDKYDGTPDETQTSNNRANSNGAAFGSHTKFVPKVDAALKSFFWGKDATLAHELKHGYNRKYGKKDGGPIEPGNKDPRAKLTTFEEVDAVNFQNILHWHQGIPLRKSYGILNIERYLIPAATYNIDPLLNKYHEK